ncbi:Chaperone protein dnaJ 49 [Acorus gramineus]|uniref:Chaperone protein dnaJ 49 n=1 Tax=Acorus gramineus TaxID=55184 RepID=A0AAV9AGY3_ACOGR|nr:Chaperone protein dnaJ 49 [Acorus gramineus]
MDRETTGNTSFAGDGGGSRAEAERFLGIAEKLLMARDLVGCKTFAERSIESDPMMDGPDHLLAVADALLSAQDRVNNHVNWYSVLQVHPSDGPDSIRRQYRRLSLLLHPDRNRFSGSEQAFKLVSDAFSVLSDPSKRSLFDKELQISNHRTRRGGDRSQPSDSSFWTACPYCCNLYEYERGYQNRRLRCRNCRRGFHATEVPVLPPVVPGTEMYYCSWGFFPLGFPGANLGPAGPGIDGWKPFVPMFPWWSPTSGFSGKGGKDGTPAVNGAAMVAESSLNKRAATVKTGTRRTKVMATRRSRRQSVASGGSGWGDGDEIGNGERRSEKMHIDLEVPGDMMMGEDMVDMDGFVEGASGGRGETGVGEVQANCGGCGVGPVLDPIDVLETLPKLPFLNSDEFDMLIK